MIVCKFGGTSLATAESFKRVADILFSNDQRRFVVVSAPGKRNADDTKVTDLLYACFSSKNNEKRIADFEHIADRFRLLHTDLLLTFDLEKYIDEYRDVLVENDNIARFVSMGEHLSALILSAYIGWDFVDARRLIVFDDKNLCDYDETYRTAIKILRSYPKAVIPGFYGRNRQYKTVLFDRGGSDITGSIIARTINADLYENWTDVSGVFVADPRVVKNPIANERLTYKELRELSYSGASVIQSDAVFPTGGYLPIAIKNTFSPFDSGTIISNDRIEPRLSVVGIVGKKGYSALTIAIPERTSKTSFISSLFSLFEKHRIQIENIYIGIDEIKVIVLQKSLDDKRKEFFGEREFRNSFSGIDWVNNLALVSVIGRGKRNKEIFLSKSIEALRREKIKFDIVGGNSTDVTIISINQSESEKVINLLYKELNK